MFARTASAFVARDSRELLVIFVIVPPTATGTVSASKPFAIATKDGGVTTVELTHVRWTATSEGRVMTVPANVLLDSKERRASFDLVPTIAVAMEPATTKMASANARRLGREIPATSHAVLVPGSTVADTELASRKKFASAKSIGLARTVN